MAGIFHILWSHLKSETECSKSEYFIMILFGSSSIFCNLSFNLLKKMEKQNYIGLSKREKKREKVKKKKEKFRSPDCIFIVRLFFGHRKLIIITEILKKHFQRLLIFGFYTLWVWLYFPIAVFKEKSHHCYYFIFRNLFGDAMQSILFKREQFIVNTQSVLFIALNHPELNQFM